MEMKRPGKATTRRPSIQRTARKCSFKRCSPDQSTHRFPLNSCICFQILRLILRPPNGARQDRDAIPLPWREGARRRGAGGSDVKLRGHETPVGRDPISMPPAVETSPGSPTPGTAREYSDLASAHAGRNPIRSSSISAPWVAGSQISR